MAAPGQDFGRQDFGRQQRRESEIQIEIELEIEIEKEIETELEIEREREPSKPVLMQRFAWPRPPLNMCGPSDC